MEKETKIKIATFIGNKVEYFECFSDNNLFVRIRKHLFYRFLNMIGLTVLPIIRKDEYKSRTGKLHERIIQENRVGYTSNVVFNTSTEEQQLLKRSLPNIVLQHFKDIYIHGDSEIIIDKDNGCVINDNYYNLDVRYTAYDGVLYRLRKNIAILRHNLKKINKVIPSGIIISGKFSKNYYHEIYENLIKLLVVEECDIPQDVPIVVDEIVARMDSFKKIFEFLTEKNNRKIVYIGDKELWHFKELYNLTPINKITAHLKDRNTIIKEDYIYDGDYLMKLRSALLPNASEKRFPVKVFISRANVNKRNFNEDEVFDVLGNYGFERVCPETMTFEEQISLFANADWIIGGSGAAFSNLLFCNPGCKVLCIVDSVKYGYPIFSTLAYWVGCKMLYYGNDISLVTNCDVHADFNVNIEKFIETLMCLQKK